MFWAEEKEEGGESGKERFVRAMCAFSLPDHLSRAKGATCESRVNEENGKTRKRYHAKERRETQHSTHIHTRTHTRVPPTPRHPTTDNDFLMPSMPLHVTSPKTLSRTDRLAAVRATMGEMKTSYAGMITKLLVSFMTSP